MLRHVSSSGVLVLLMSRIFRLQRSSTTRKLLFICGALVVTASGILGVPVRRHAHNIERRDRVSGSVLHATRNEPDVPSLKIDRIIQHGHIVEIQAMVPPGATVMVNGERAAVIWEDGEIRHFVGPLPDGVSEIAITVQNDSGGTNTQQLSVSLP